MRRFGSAIGLLSSWVFFTGSVPASAQSRTDSLFLVQQGLTGIHWRLSGNPVHLGDMKSPDYAEAGLFYSRVGGRFRRPQEALRAYDGGFGGEGLSSWKDWKFYGRFSYSKHRRDSIRFSNAARPYDGNPFLTADSVGGDWRGDRLDARLQAMLPAYGKIRPAVRIDYETEQSARRNEPKPLYRYLVYRVQPAIAFRLSGKTSLSVTGAYQRKSETTETGFFSNTNPPLYSLRGYGTFSRGPVVTAERYTSGWGWEAGADLRRKSGRRVLSAGATLGYRTEDVNDGVSAPVFVGGLDETSGRFFAALETQSGLEGWSAGVSGWFRDGKGYDAVFQAVNPAYYFSGLSAQAGWWKQRRPGTWMAINLYPAITYTNYFESIARTNWTSVMLQSDVALTLQHTVSDTWTLLVSPGIGYRHNLQSDLVINRPTPISFLLVRPDFDVNSADSMKGAFAAGADLRAGAWQYRLRLRYERMQEIGQPARSRSFFQTTFNLLF